MLFHTETEPKIRLDVLLARLASVIIVAGTPIMRYHSLMVNKTQSSETPSDHSPPTEAKIEDQPPAEMGTGEERDSKR
jgi:hypothetical protein